MVLGALADDNRLVIVKPQVSDLLIEPGVAFSTVKPSLATLGALPLSMARLRALSWACLASTSRSRAWASAAWARDRSL
jgi:hypothetical protein